MYHDSRRIASFLAQFEGDGHLQQFTRTKDHSKGKRETSGHEARGNVGIAAGKLHGGTETSLDLSDGYSKVFDPYWANARAFLDYLSDRDMLQRELEAARMGQIVLVKGSLIISDLKMLQALWDLPTVKNSMIKAVQATGDQEAETPPAGQNRLEKRKAQAQKRYPAKVEIPDELAITMEVLPHMPHGGQMHIVAGDHPIWAPISDGCLVSPISELILKHGPKIAGEWSAVGILDALPWEEGAEMTALEMIKIGMMGASISNAALSLAGPIREVMGRPLLSYGMTPLLVFREVA